MKSNSVIFEKPPTNNIALEDCDFQHIIDIPGVSSEHMKGTKTDQFPEGEPTPYDIRKGVNELLGYVDFKNKTVLNLGQSNGFLSFHAEKEGADVTSIDLDIKNINYTEPYKNRDVVPRVKCNWQEELTVLMQEEERRRNAYWYTHKALNSKAKLIHAHACDLPRDLGIYDISLLYTMLVHIRDPYLALQNMLRHTGEKVIIIELGGYTRRKSFRNIIRNLIRRIMPPSPPSMIFLPCPERTPYKWWKLSPEIIINMVNILGFEKTSINYHTQLADGRKIFLYTVVCERTVPIEDCNYG